MNTILAEVGEQLVRLRVAHSPADQAQGFRGAAAVEPTDGIFFEDLPPNSSFTMQGVRFALAIAFLDADRKVISARVMEPGQVWIPTPLGTRHAVELHPQHLPALEGGKLALREASQRLSVKSVVAKEDSASEKLARKFHEAYEWLAPDHGYETRKESAKPWSDVPENNKSLMIAVCAELLKDWPNQSPD